MLQIFANQAAIAIRNARLFRDVREAKEQAVEAQKLTEEALKEAEIANQAKSAFLANMSHELRTPLNAVLGFAQIMVKNAHSSEEEEYLRIIQRSGTHLLTLINQVLELSKVESGRLMLNERPTDLLRLLEEIDEIFALRAKSKDIQFCMECGVNIPRYVHLDDVKLRYIFMSILQNAIKFTSKGSITLRIGERTPTGSDQPHEMPNKEHPLLNSHTLQLKSRTPDAAFLPKNNALCFKLLRKRTAISTARKGSE